MPGITITPAIDWTFAFTEQAGVTGSNFLHTLERSGTLTDAGEFQLPDLDHAFVYSTIFPAYPVLLPFNVLWESGRVVTPISWTGPGPTPASGPVFATISVLDSQIDFLRQNQVLTQFIDVTVTDLNDGEDTTVRLTYTVTGRNDAPQAFLNLSTINENITTFTNKVTGNDFDPDHGGPTVPGDTIGITAAETAVFSVASAFSTFLNVGDVTIQRVNFLNNALVLKDSIKATLGTAFQSLMTGQTALVTINYQIADDWGATDGAQFKITVTGLNDAQIFGTAGSVRGCSARMTRTSSSVWPATILSTRAPATTRFTATSESTPSGVVLAGIFSSDKRAMTASSMARSRNQD